VEDRQRIMNAVHSRLDLSGSWD